MLNKNYSVTTEKFIVLSLFSYCCCCLFVCFFSFLLFNAIDQMVELSIALSVQVVTVQSAYLNLESKRIKLKVSRSCALKRRSRSFHPDPTLEFSANQRKKNDNVLLLKN